MREESGAVVPLPQFGQRQVSFTVLIATLARLTYVFVGWPILQILFLSLPYIVLFPVLWEKSVTKAVATCPMGKVHDLLLCRILSIR